MQIQTVTVPAWAALMGSLQRGYVKWILDLLCLQQVTYCCAGLSAALEKPFKQDNLSASRHCSALFPRARTKHWDKGAVWLGIWSNWSGRIKGYFLQSITVCHWTSWRRHKHWSKWRWQKFSISPKFYNPSHFLQYLFLFVHFFLSLWLSLTCVYCFMLSSSVALCSRWKQLLLSTKPVDVLDIRCDSWVRAMKELLSFLTPQGVLGDKPTTWHSNYGVHFLCKFVPHGC